jgi:hypothetical protein
VSDSQHRDLVRQYRNRSLPDLVDEWDLPLTEAEREALASELRSRGYRVATLPAPMASSAVASTAPATLPHAVDPYYDPAFDGPLDASGRTTAQLNGESEPMEPREREQWETRLRTGRVQMRLAGLAVMAFASLSLLLVFAARETHLEQFQALGVDQPSLFQLLVGPVQILLVGLAVFTGSRLGAVAAFVVIATSQAIVMVRTDDAQGLPLTLGVLALTVLGMTGTVSFQKARRALQPRRPARAIGWRIYSWAVSVPSLVLMGIGGLAMFTGRI